MSELNQIAGRVGQLIKNKEAKLSIVVQTGYDESGLVGTRDAYLRLVEELLQFLSDAESEEKTLPDLTIGEMKLPHSADIGALFNSRCEIELDTTTLTTSEAQTEEVVDYFYLVSPPSPQNRSTDQVE